MSEINLAEILEALEDMRNIEYENQAPLDDTELDYLTDLVEKYTIEVN